MRAGETSIAKLLKRIFFDMPANLLPSLNKAALLSATGVATKHNDRELDHCQSPSTLPEVLPRYHGRKP